MIQSFEASNTKGYKKDISWLKVPTTGIQMVI
jgi:hypothetical protein